jgi:hypothetical protein
MQNLEKFLFTRTCIYSGMLVHTRLPFREVERSLRVSQVSRILIDHYPLDEIL